MLQSFDAGATLYTIESTLAVAYGVPNAKVVPTTTSGKTLTGSARPKNKRGPNTEVKGTDGQQQVRRDTKIYQGGSGTVNKWDKVKLGAPVANARCSSGHESYIAPGYLLV